MGSPAVLSGILGSPAVLSGIFVLIIQGFRLELDLQNIEALLIFT